MIHLAIRANRNAALRAGKDKISRHVHAQGINAYNESCGRKLASQLDSKKSKIFSAAFASKNARDSSYVPYSTIMAAAVAITIGAWDTTTVSSSEGAFETQGVGLGNDQTTIPSTENMMEEAKPCIRQLGTALARLHERQKVQLGRLLHGFHQLMLEETSTESETSPIDEENKGTSEEDSQTENISTSSRANIAFIDVPQEPLSDLKPHETWEMIERIRRGGIFSQEDLKRVVHSASEVVRQEPTVNDLRERTDLKKITIVGDLHGDINSLFEVLSFVGKHDCDSGSETREETDGSPWNGTGAIVFNGDFVDRGENSLGVILVLLLLKIVYPKHVYLNRGNHEDALLATVYGFSEELQARYGVSNVDDVWKALGGFFSTLPLCVRTDIAAIMHGGLPSDGFQLSELESITPDQRSKIESLLDPEDDALCELIQNVLWSDPKPEYGIHPNEDRGAGVFFGPDVTDRFLKDHGLAYLIRSHEVVDEGYDDMESRNGHSAITVFSSARYPNGEGDNFGSVIQLSSDGMITPLVFQGQHHSENDFDEEYFERTLNSLVEVIAENKMKLLTAFKEKAGAGKLVTIEQWADVMSCQMDLHGVDWISIQPFLAPTIIDEHQEERSDLVDFQKFLDLHCNVLSSSIGELDDETMETLRRNHAILLTVFKFLDTDGNGVVDRDEFRRGLELLNKKFPNQHKFDDPDAVFDAIDIDGSGEIEMDEFEKAFQSVEMPYSEAVFKLFDKDRNGTIDRDEFKEALNFLNSRLAPENQFSIEESDLLFDKMDIDRSGVLEFDEFKHLLSDVTPEQS